MSVKIMLFGLVRAVCTEAEKETILQNCKQSFVIIAQALKDRFITMDTANKLFYNDEKKNKNNLYTLRRDLKDSPTHKAIIRGTMNRNGFEALPSDYKEANDAYYKGNYKRAFELIASGGFLESLNINNSRISEDFQNELNEISRSSNSICISSGKIYCKQLSGQNNHLALQVAETLSNKDPLDIEILSLLVKELIFANRITEAKTKIEEYCLNVFNDIGDGKEETFNQKVEEYLRNEGDSRILDSLRKLKEGKYIEVLTFLENPLNH